MHEENKQKAQARAGLITVLTRRLESSHDLLARIVAAELRDDANWRAFTRGIVRYYRRRRKIARKMGYSILCDLREGGVVKVLS